MQFRNILQYTIVKICTTAVKLLAIRSVHGLVSVGTRECLTQLFHSQLYNVHPINKHADNTNSGHAVILMDAAWKHPDMHVRFF